MSTKSHFIGFYDDLHQYLQSVSMSDEYLLNSTHTDVNSTQKMIENAQNHQILSCKWPQYHFSLGFMMVYINICSMLVSQINIYLDRTHNDVN